MCTNTCSGGTASDTGVAKDHSVEDLDPLRVLPTLLPCGDDATRMLIDRYGRHANVKEIMIVVEETLEDLQWRLRATDDDDDDYDDDRSNLTTPSVPRLLNTIVLCATAMPRSKPGKWTPLEQMSPVVAKLTSLAPLAAPHVGVSEGRAFLTEVARFCKSLFRWASTSAPPNDLDSVKGLHELLDTTVMAFADSIQASLSARVFESLYPRLTVKSAVQHDWVNGDRAICEVQDALSVLGFSVPTNVRGPASVSDLVYLAHARPPAALTASMLSHLHPTLVTSLCNNVAVDESLTVLLRILTETAPHAHGLTIPPDIVSALCTILPALASTHINPFFRHLNLRLVSLLLSQVDPTPRFGLLVKLTAERKFPQFRGPAIGLLKEAVLEALSSPIYSVAQNPFASPLLMSTFGPVLFKPDPPDFFSIHHTDDELSGSLELLRIVDCLSFYYVLLLRDQENKTGIRDASVVTSVQRSLLGPLGRFLELRTGSREELPVMALQSLKVSLERINDALSSIQAPFS